MSRNAWMFAISPLLLGGCDPFTSMTTDKDFAVPDGQGATLELLTPERRLPKSAINIKGHLLQFQDPLLYVRFDAPLGEAMAFSTAMMRDRGSPCDHWPEARADLWPKALPPGAQCLKDKAANELPPIVVAVVPHGATATVFVHTFSD